MEMLELIYFAAALFEASFSKDILLMNWGYECVCKRRVPTHMHLNAVKVGSHSGYISIRVQLTYARFKYTTWFDRQNIAVFRIGKNDFQVEL